MNAVLLNSQQLSAASRLFSPTVYRELANKGRSPVFARLANELLPLNLIDGYSPIQELFDLIYDQLKSKNYRHEYIYKTAITHKILLGKHSLNTAVLLNEFRVQDRKADVVVINGTSNVYEIKTERDSLRRLEKQVTTYRLVFANINVIVGMNHLETVLSTVPESVGVLLLSDRYQISTVRESIESTTEIQSETIFDSIRLSESKAILKNVGIEIPEVPNTKTYFALKKLFHEIPKEVAHEQMVRVLIKTRNQSKQSSFLKELPKSLVSTAVSTRISIRDRNRLVKALNTPLDKAISWG